MKLFLTIMSLFFTGSLFSQTTYFNENYDILGYQDISTSIAYSDSTLLVVGTSNDSLFRRRLSVLEIDTSGNVIRKKEYGSYNEWYYVPYPKSIVKSESGYFIAGTISDMDSHKGFLLKLNQNLDSLWLKYFEIDTFTVDLFCISESGDNHLLITGTRDTTNNIKDRDIFIAKLDTLGNIKWFNTYGTNTGDYVRSMSVGPDFSIYLGGYNKFGNLYRQLIIKVDSSGNEVWQKKFGNPDGDNQSAYVTATSDSGVVFASSYLDYKPSIVSWYAYGYIGKIDKAGVVEWEKKYNGSKYWQMLGRIIELDNGDYLAVGNSPLPSNGGKTGGWLLRINNNGDSLWSRSYIKYVDNQPLYSLRDVLAANDGGFYVAGEMTNRYFECDTSSNRSQDFWVMKVDSMGCLFEGCDTVCGTVLPDFTYSQDSGYYVTFTYSGSPHANFWRWYYGDGNFYPVEAFCQTEPVVVNQYPGPGTYLVELSVQDPCGNYDTISKWITVQYVGIEDHDKKNTQLQIYPNPAKDKFNIHYSPVAEETYDLELVDVSGRRFLQKTILSEKTEIFVDHLEAGIYYAIIKREGRIIDKAPFVIVK